MFKWLWRHVKRNKWKYIVGSVFFSGSYLLQWWVRRKLNSLFIAEKQKFWLQAKKERIFEKAKKVCRDTIPVVLSGVMASKIEDISHVEQLLNELKHSTSDKVMVWDELKTVGVSMILLTVYVGVYVSLLLRVQIFMLSGFIFSLRDDLKSDFSESSQRLFLENYVNRMVDNIDLLLARLTSAVRDVTAEINLTQSLSAHDVIVVFENIDRCVHKEDLFSFLLSTPPYGETDDIVRVPTELAKETAVVVNSPNFVHVVQTCTSSVFSFIESELSVAFEKRSYETTFPLARIIPQLCNLNSPPLLRDPNFMRLLMENSQAQELSIIVSDIFLESADD